MQICNWTWIYTFLLAVCDIRPGYIKSGWNIRSRYHNQIYRYNVQNQAYSDALFISFNLIDNLMDNSLRYLGNNPSGQWEFWPKLSTPSNDCAILFLAKLPLTKVFFTGEPAKMLYMKNWGGETDSRRSLMVIFPMVRVLTVPTPLFLDSPFSRTTTGKAGLGDPAKSLNKDHNLSIGIFVFLVRLATITERS